MKLKNSSQYIIAITVIACSLVLLAALTFSLNGFSWNRGERTLEIDFHDATGIKLHSPVRYAGAPAGVVTRIRYLAPEERKKLKDQKNAVRVTVALNDDVPPVPSDVIARLGAETILGEKFVSLSAGTPGARPLPEGAVIQGRDAMSFEALAGSAQVTVENLNRVLERFNSDYPDLMVKLAALLDQGNSLLAQGSNFVRNAGGTLTNANDVLVQFRSDYTGFISKLDSLLNQGTNIAAEAELALHQVTSFAHRADLLLETNEVSIHKMVNELRVVSQNLKVISTHAKALTGALGERPSRLIWGIKRIPLPTEQEILESSEPLPIIVPNN